MDKVWTITCDSPHLDYEAEEKLTKTFASQEQAEKYVLHLAFECNCTVRVEALTVEPLDAVGNGDASN